MCITIMYMFIIKFLGGASWVFRDVVFQDVGFEDNSFKPLAHISYYV